MPSPSWLIMNALQDYADELRGAEEYGKAHDIDILVEAANRATHLYPGDREACVREVVSAGKATGRLPDRHLEQLIEDAR